VTVTPVFVPLGLNVSTALGSDRSCVMPADCFVKRTR
jgi:hypothetical protein